MEIIITKMVKNFTYYAKFPSAPLHYRYCTWQGLRDNGTVFTDDNLASTVMANIQKSETEQLFKTRL